MNNPARHNLDDVTLRAENGQLVLEVDGSTINVDVDGRLSLDQLEGFSEDQIDLVQSKLVNAGFDGVDVPSTVELTVDDFEAGVLDESYIGDTDLATVQSSIVNDGSFALEFTSPTSSSRRVYSPSGLEAYPQSGDKFSFSYYQTDVDDEIDISFAIQDDDTTGGVPNNAYTIRLGDGSSGIELTTDGFSGSIASDTINISNYLNEWMTVYVSWGVNGDIDITLFDSTGAEIAEISAQDKTYQNGYINIRGRNSEIAWTFYIDSWTITRRTKEYLTDTKKGTTQLGNELTPSGAINTGPQEILDADGVLADIAVSPDVEAGTPVGGTITLNQDPAFSIKGESDGSGGVQNAKIESNLPFEALEAESLNSKPATVTTDDKGQFRAVGSVLINSGSDVSTTSTEFETLTGTSDSGTVPKDKLWSNTNIDGKNYVSLTAHMRADEATIRVSDSPETEITDESFQRVSGPIGEFIESSSGDAGDVQIEMKVEEDGDTAQARAITVWFWEEIEQ